MTAIVHRRGTAEVWATINPILASGEIGYESDTGKHKMGDGITQWTGLEYFLPESILKTLFSPIGNDSVVSLDSIVSALTEQDKTIGATLIQADTPINAREAIGAFGAPPGLRVQVIMNFTSLTGLTRPDDPLNQLAVEFRGPVNPASVMQAFDSWVVVL